MQKIEIHEINAILNQMNDELDTFQQYKKKKIQKIYDVFKLDREKLKTITNVTCSHVLYPIFLNYFGDILRVSYSTLVKEYEFIFSDETEIDKLKDLNFHGGYIGEKTFPIDLFYSFGVTIKK